MKEIIATGKNIEKAIANGLEELNAKFEDVDVEIISEGGIFSKAKVKITLSQEDDTPEEPVFVAIKKEAGKPQEQEKENDGLTISLHKEEIKKDEVVENLDNQINTIKEEPKTENKEVKKHTFISTTTAVEFIKELLNKAEIDCKVEVNEDDKFINVSICGDNLSGVIGNKGECLSAIQYLSSLVKGESEKGKKVLIDAGDYKKNREQKIKELAERIIAKVKETGRWEKLKPMTAYERRIVHEVVNLTDGVRGESKGEEPNRYLTIYPDKK